MLPNPQLTSINLRLSEENRELQSLEKRISNLQEKINIFLMKNELDLNISDSLKELQMVTQKYIELARGKSNFLEEEVKGFLQPGHRKY